MLTPRDEWRAGISKDEIVDELKSVMDREPGIEYNFTQPIAMRVDELVAGVKSDVAVKIFGPDFNVLRDAADKIENIARRIPGVGNTMIEQISGQTYLDISIDRNKIARYGIDVADVQNVIETAIGGKVATELFEGERRFDVLVRYEESSRNSLEAIRNTPVDIPGGARMPLSQLSAIEPVEGPVQISRENGQRRLVVGINLADSDISGYVTELQRGIEGALSLPPGYFLQFGGQFENQQRAMNRLYLVVPLTLLIIYLLLFSMFGLLRHALLILINLPFALSGGLLALWLTGLNISVSSSIGFIALFGVAVLNGIVLIERINHRRKDGEELEFAVTSGALDRLRAVLMTALVASLGFIPMAINTMQGSEVQRPLATVVIGGLITSTLLTLLVLPTIYTYIERRADSSFPVRGRIKRLLMPRKLL